MSLVASVSVCLLIVLFSTASNGSGGTGGLLLLILFYVGVPQLLQAAVAQAVFRRRTRWPVRAVTIVGVLALGTLAVGLLLPLTSGEERLQSTAFLLSTTLPVTLAVCGMVRLFAYGWDRLRDKTTRSRSS